MNSDAPKISFIPKSPLAQTEPFLVRSRPRSLISIVAFLVFFVSVGSYVGISLYSNSLTKKIEGLTTQIQEMQKSFDQQEIKQARIFHARAKLVQELLDMHIAPTPIFDFLEENTVRSVFYNDLAFKKGEGGQLTVELKGEAPSYASLAYQADVLRQRKSELSSFTVDDVTLTKMGSIEFVFKIAFTPEYLLYIKQFTEGGQNLSFEETMTSLAESKEEGSDAPRISCEKPLTLVLEDDGSVVCQESTSPVQSFQIVSFLQWLKFW